MLGSPVGFNRTVILVWWKLLRELWRFRPTYIEVHNVPVGLPVLLLWRAAYFFHGPAHLEAQAEGVGPWRTTLSRWLEVLVFWRATKVYVASDAYAALVRDLYRQRFATGQLPRRRYPLLVRGPEKTGVLGLGDSSSTLGAAGGLDSVADDQQGRQGTPAKSVRQESFASDWPLVLVCVRRLVRRTGVLELVEAFATAVSDGRLHSSTTLHVVGDGPMRPAIEARVASKRGCARVIVHGRVSDEVRELMYSTSDINLVPTQALEGFGLVVIEAALHGCPSMVTDVGALPEVLAQLDHIGVVCRRDPSSLSEALARLRRFSPSERQRLARLAFERFVFRAPSRA